MFAYCNNNPVLYMDNVGNSATIAGGMAGGIFGFLGAAVSELTDDNNEFRWDKVLICTISGAATGAAAGFIADVSIVTYGVGTAMIVSTLGGAATSVANSFVTQQTLCGEVDCAKLTSDAVIGGITNGISTGMSDAFKPVVNSLSKGVKYVETQIITAFIPNALNVGKFLINDLLPSLIAGFGAWYGGIQYDILVRE